MQNVRYTLACAQKISIKRLRSAEYGGSGKGGVNECPHYSDFLANSAWFRRLGAVLMSFWPPALPFSRSAAQSAAPTVLVKEKKMPTRGTSSRRTAGTPKLCRVLAFLLVV